MVSMAFPCVCVGGGGGGTFANAVDFKRWGEEEARLLMLLN